MSIFRKGSRLFSSASIGLILVALLHQFGHVSPPPADPARDQAIEAMQTYRLSLPLGMRPSLRNVLQALSLTMTITFIALGVLNLLLAAGDREDGRMVRRFSLASTLYVAALVAVFAWHRISPPLVLMSVVGAMFLLAFGLASRRDAGGAGGA